MSISFQCLSSRFLNKWADGASKLNTLWEIVADISNTITEVILPDIESYAGFMHFIILRPYRQYSQNLPAERNVQDLQIYRLYRMGERSFRCKFHVNQFYEDAYEERFLHFRSQ